jgi:peptidoglycan/xylan/chitin deacetylase (PgdA/CDA1 family)
MCLSEPARSSLAIAALALGVMSVSACEGPPGQTQLPGPGPETAEVFAAPANPQIDFSPRPSYLPDNTIVLTFDDGPDSTNTARVLDILRSRNVRATFFINSQNYTDIETDPNAQAVLRRIVNEGHELGNHTARHLDLSTLSEDSIEDEISRVEEAVRDIVSPSRRLTLLRAPFGIPYDPDGDTSGFPKVAPIVARHAVHIGWSITPQDFACGDASCVFEGVRDALEAGDYGVVLLHSPLPQTVGALPDIIDFARANGYTFKLTEDVVRARFGQSSGEIIDE